MYENLWLKRVLIPLWTIQLLFVLILLGISAFGLHLFIENKDEISDEIDNDGYGSNGDQITNRASGVVAVFIAICSLTILLDIVEIVLFARKKLGPIVEVALSAVTTLIWGVIFILGIVGLAGSGVSLLGLIFYFVIFLTCKGKLIYSAVILHRYRRGLRARGAYTPAQAESGFDTAYTAYNPASSPPNPFRDHSPAAIQQPVGGGAADSYYANPKFGSSGPYEMTQPVQHQSGAHRYG